MHQYGGPSIKSDRLLAGDVVPPQEPFPDHLNLHDGDSGDAFEGLVVVPHAVEEPGNAEPATDKVVGQE
jgi:hypothetical protein